MFNQKRVSFFERGGFLARVGYLGSLENSQGRDPRDGGEHHKQQAHDGRNKGTNAFESRYRRGRFSMKRYKKARWDARGLHWRKRRPLSVLPRRVAIRAGLLMLAVQVAVAGMLVAV